MSNAIVVETLMREEPARPADSVGFKARLVEPMGFQVVPSGDQEPVKVLPARMSRSQKGDIKRPQVT